MRTLYSKVIIPCSESGHDEPHEISVQTDEEGSIHLVIASHNDGTSILAAFKERNEALEYAVLLAHDLGHLIAHEQREAWFNKRFHAGMHVLFGVRIER